MDGEAGEGRRDECILSGYEFQGGEILGVGAFAIGHLELIRCPSLMGEER